MVHSISHLPLWKRLLVIDEWTEMGAHVTDLYSKRTFHLPLDRIEQDFYPFTHTSPDGEEGDMALLIHTSLIDSFND